VKNKARIVRTSKAYIYLEVTIGKTKVYFEICPIGSAKEHVFALSEYFQVNLSK
jgi:hypothetical protein